MIDTEALRKKVIDLAIRGKLTEQLPSDGDAETLYAQIQEEKAKLVKEGKIKKDKPLPEITEDEIPFEIPKNWKWVRIGEIARVYGGKRIPAGRSLTLEDTGYKYIRVSDMKNRTIITETLQFVPKDIYPSISRYIINKEDVYITVAGTIGKVGKIPEEIDGANLTENADRLVFNFLSQDWLIWCLSSLLIQKQIEQLTTQVAQPKLAIKRIQEFALPLPPIDEQNRIAKVIDKVYKQTDIIDELQSKYSNDLAVLKSKIIDAGIQGKLTEQLLEDGDAETLYVQIQEEKARLIQEGKIKKEKPLPDISVDEIPFEIPKNWKWVRFGVTTFIERGGSPRPIKSYITDSEDGINWIKIGDVEKGGKYIYSTKEKIIPEGEKKSRHVYPGDFLLTNSMSFGRPYISKVEGCIHDGWLLIRDLNGFSADYLYYLLSSRYMYGQFCNKASGATVDNLNIDKVNTAMIPLPPLNEQKRIASKIEAILEYLQ